MKTNKRQQLTKFLFYYLCCEQVVPAEEHALKIAAAREAIGDDDFFLVARTDARAPHGLQEAIKRANLYKEVSTMIGFRSVFK